MGKCMHTLPLLPSRHFGEDPSHHNGRARLPPLLELPQHGSFRQSTGAAGRSGAVWVMQTRAFTGSMQNTIILDTKTGHQTRSKWNIIGDNNEMENSDNEKQFLTVKQFSQISGLSETTVRRRVKGRQIDAWQPGGAGTRLLISRKYLQGVCDLPLNPSADTSARLSQNDQIPGPKPKWKQS